MELVYAIKYVGDMDAAVAFFRDRIGLTLRFASPEWSEFDTGATTLALHIASAENPPGSVQLGLGTPDLAAFHANAEAQGVVFTSPPREMHGTSIARVRDPDGAEISISGGRATQA